MGPGGELQVLRLAGEMCYGIGEAILERSGRQQFPKMVPVRNAVRSRATDPFQRLRSCLEFFFEHFVEQAAQAGGAFMALLHFARRSLG